MSIATNVVRRGAVYYFRCRVPVELIAKMQRREIWLSLRTKNLVQARQKAAALAIVTAQLWQRVRCSVLTPSEIHNVVRDFLSKAVPQAQACDERYLWSPNLGKTPPEKLAGDEVLMSRYMIENQAELEMEHWRNLHRAGDYQHAAPQARMLISELKLPISEDSGEFQRLCERLTLATANLHGARMEALAGDYTCRSLGSDGSFAKAPTSTEPSKPGDTLRSVIDAYMDERRRKGLKYKADKKITRSLELFAKWAGPDKEISSLKKRTIGEFRSLLTKLPANCGSKYSGLPLDELIAKAKTEGLASLRSNTVKAYIAGVSGMLEWCESGGRIEVNPAAGVRVISSDEESYSPFERHHLDKIFHAPLFAGCAGQKRVFEPGDYKVRNWKYWLIVVGLFTGARIEEICQLQPCDIELNSGIWCFNIRPDGDRSLKTKASSRLLPIHPMLKALGFLEFAEDRRKEGARLLLPGLETRIKGRLSHYPSKWFLDFLIRTIGKEEKGVRKLVFHSFRHTIKDAMREAEIEEAIQYRLVGHKMSTIGEKYGKGPGLAKLEAAMNKILMPVDLSHLVA